MRQLFQILITGEIPEGDRDMGAHAHVAAVPSVAALVKTLGEMGMIHVEKHIRVIRQNKPATAVPTAKLREPTKAA